MLGGGRAPETIVIREEQEMTQSSGTAVTEPPISETTKDVVNVGQIMQSRKSSIDPRGTPGAPLIIPQRLNWAQPNFSSAEREFFTAAASGGKVSQTHFDDPDAVMCYSCPSCDRSLNPNGLTKDATRHILRTRNTPDRVYFVTLNEAANKQKKQIRKQTRSLAPKKAGAEPPQHMPTVNAVEVPLPGRVATQPKKFRAGRRRLRTKISEKKIAQSKDQGKLTESWRSRQQARALRRIPAAIRAPGLPGKTSPK